MTISDQFMCGICGQIDLDFTTPIDVDLLKSMNRALRHRGPDDEGMFTDGYVGLAMRRLSIIDIAGGKQPIANEDKSIRIVFNGEIYNFREIRDMLLAKGHIFATDSDTESIIHLYEEVGIEFVNYLRGMFSIAIWDSREKKLLLVRDRLGIKPLFYGINKGRFFFSSEMKSILINNTFPRDIDYNALSCYFTLGYIPAPLTIYKHIRKLHPAHILVVTRSGIQSSQYWDIHFHPDRSNPARYFINNFMELLDEAVKIRLISEVPLGAFLSGGIDSGLIVAHMNNYASEPTRTFCIGFGGNTGGYLDERIYAQQVSSRYQTRHKEYLVSPDPYAVISKIVQAFDEPFADHSTIPTYYLCKTVRENVTVALSGLGGDEVFGGYERYLGFKLSSFYKYVPHYFRDTIIRNLLERIPERADGHYTINHLKRFIRSASLPQDLCYFGFLSMLGPKRKDVLLADQSKHMDGYYFCRDLITNYFNAPNASDPLDRAFYCDIKTYLPEDILACTDRMSMFHSLEVRVPFLDHKFMEFCATIPSELKINLFSKKHILKKAASHLLPTGVINHRKQGFVGPMTRWLQTDLKSYVKNILSEKNLSKHGIINHKTVSTICEEHFNGLQINDRLIWSLVIFQEWYNNYIENNDSRIN